MEGWEAGIEELIASLKRAESREGRPTASEVVGTLLARMEEEDMT